MNDTYDMFVSKMQLPSDIFHIISVRGGLLMLVIIVHHNPTLTVFSIPFAGSTEIVVSFVQRRSDTCGHPI